MRPISAAAAAMGSYLIPSVGIVLGLSLLLTGLGSRESERLGQVEAAVRPRPWMRIALRILDYSLRATCMGLVVWGSLSWLAPGHLVPLVAPLNLGLFLLSFGAAGTLSLAVWTMRREGALLAIGSHGLLWGGLFVPWAHIGEAQLVKDVFFGYHVYIRFLPSPTAPKFGIINMLWYSTNPLFCELDQLAIDAIARHVPVTRTFPDDETESRI